MCFTCSVHDEKAQEYFRELNRQPPGIEPGASDFSVSVTLAVSALPPELWPPGVQYIHVHAVLHECSRPEGLCGPARVLYSTCVYMYMYIYSSYSTLYMFCTKWDLCMCTCTVHVQHLKKQLSGCCLGDGSAMFVHVPVHKL